MQKRVGNVRWRIAALLGVGIVINYLDTEARLPQIRLAWLGL